MYRQFVKSCKRIVHCRQSLMTTHKSSVLVQRIVETSWKTHDLGIKRRDFCTSVPLCENWLQHNRRLANPDSIDRNDYIESLCLSLHDSRPDRYRFFDALAKKRRTLLAIDSGAKEVSENGGTALADSKLFAREEHEAELLELVKLFGKDGVEQKCLEKFQSWADKSKLSIAYTLYANNLKCDEFLTRLVRHLAPQIEVLQPEEFVALLLVIYLHKSWSPEELFDVLDPTALQLRLARLISNHEISNIEICVACHGLKKIDGFVAKESELREALYTRAIAIARNVYSNGESSYTSDMTILHIIVLLRQGNLVKLDRFKLVNKFLTAFVPASNLIEPRTIAKVMAFGLVKNYHYPELTASVLTRIIQDGDISGLSLKDICSMLKFIVMINLDEVVNTQQKAVLVDIIVQELNSMMDENCSLMDVVSLLQSWSYLAQYQYFETSKLERLFASINEISDDKVDGMSVNELSLAVCEATYKALFPLSFIQAQPDMTASPKKLINNLIRNVASLDQTLAVFAPEFKAEHGIRQKIIAALIKMNQSAIVVVDPSKSQLQKSLTTRRQRIFSSIFKELIQILGGDYVKMVHVLPHYQEPDIVFGHIGGVKLSVPSKFSELDSAASLKPAPDVGEWFVITTEARFFNEVPEETRNELILAESSSSVNNKFQVPETAEPFKHRQLKNLGYNIVTVNENDIQKFRIRQWTLMMIATIFTGNAQPPPNPRSVPVM